MTTLFLNAKLLSRLGKLAACLYLLGTSFAQAEETLKTGTDLTYPPYNYIEAGQPAGFDTKFMRLVTKNRNASPQFMDTRFANVIMGSNTNKFNVIASTLYVTPERVKQIDYIPYMKTGGILLALKDGMFNPIRPGMLCGKKK